MNEYELELQTLRQTLNQLRLDEAKPEVIEEHDCELRNLTAIYTAAQQTFAIGADDAELQHVLVDLGFGDWILENVYSFVYEAAMDVDLAGEDLALLVNQTDYAASLRLAAKA